MNVFNVNNQLISDIDIMRVTMDRNYDHQHFIRMSAYRKRGGEKNEVRKGESKRESIREKGRA